MRDPVVFYERMKARKKDDEYIIVTGLVVMRSSIDALGESRSMGSTYFSVPLNHGFSKPIDCCEKYTRRYRKDLKDGKYQDKGLTEADIDFIESTPVLHLRSESHGLKPIARAMGFMDAGARLKFRVDIHKDYDHVTHSETVSNLTDNDKAIIERFNNIERRLWQ